MVNIQSLKDSIILEAKDSDIHTQHKVNLLNAFRDKYGDEVIEIVEKVEGENSKVEWEKVALI